jgi:hypothetical protein
MSRPAVRTLDGLLGAHERRIGLLERRLQRAGGGGGGASVIGGTGIVVTGVDPRVVSIDPDYLPPALPDPQVSVGAASTLVTTSAGAWGNVAGWGAITITPARDLWVRVPFTGLVIASTSGGYVGVGISVSGGVSSVLPPNDPFSGQASAWGQSPFGYAPSVSNGVAPVTGEKVLKIPGGVATTFTPQAIRSVASGSTAINYPIFRVIPMYWDDAAVPVRPTTAALTRRIVSTTQAWTTAESVVLMGGTELDSGHFSYNAATGEFTCLVAGQYRLTAGLGSGGASGGGYFRVGIDVNAVRVGEDLATRDTSGGRTVMSTVSKTLAVGDKVRVIQQVATAGGNITIDTARSYIELVPIVQMDDGSDIDTGWIDLSSYLVNGFSASANNVQGRIVGKEVEIRGSMTTPTTAVGSGALDWASGLPTEFRPTSRIGFGTGVNNGYAPTFYVRTDGSAAVSLRDGLNGTSQFTIKYFRG